MMGSTEFKFGDRVTHTGRPEWGVGVVTAAQSLVLDGKACQRLTLRFERAGLKTVSTAVAELRAATEAAAGVAAPGSSEARAVVGVAAEGGGGPSWLGSLEGRDRTPAQVFAELPEETRDPFRTRVMRLKSTLDLYRFSSSGSSLLDWAAVQSGMKDPLSSYTRQDLEGFFERYAFEREAQLKRLIGEMSVEERAEAVRAAEQGPVAGRDVVKRLIARR